MHHAAFGNLVLGITPDYEVEIRQDVLEEIDGPMLRHGLQEMHGRRLTLPRPEDVRPDRQLLDVRYDQFKTAHTHKSDTFDDSPPILRLFLVDS